MFYLCELKESYTIYQYTYSKALDFASRGGGERILCIKALRAKSVSIYFEGRYYFFSFERKEYRTIHDIYEISRPGRDG